MKIGIFLLASSIIFSGCASKSLVEVDRDVPKLVVKIDCVQCGIKDSVALLIKEGYAEAASENKVKILFKESATVTIVEYIARSSGSRVLMGIMGDQDLITVRVKYRDTQFEVRDRYINAIYGIDDLARKIGRNIYEEMQTLDF